MVIYIENSLEEISKRSGFGEEAYENLDFQGKVKRVYEEELMREEWLKINGIRDIDCIAKNILEEVSKFLKKNFDINNKELISPKIKSLFID